MIELLLGDCRERLKDLPDCSVDSIVTDPPYELGFMGKSWDSTGVAYDVAVWAECLRVLKHGGHLLAFGGSRTYHRLAVAIEDAGFQIRDQIMWVYGSGFPKSLNISKAIDKAAGAERQDRIVEVRGKSGSHENPTRHVVDAGTPSTAEAKEWDGWGTALKPAHEPIVLARKPLDGTVANNVLTYGVGGLNIDGCRVAFASEDDKTESTAKNQHEDFKTAPMTNNTTYGDYSMVKPKNYNPSGRFPANFIHDGSDEVLQLFPSDKPDQSAARFFYCAKASKKDRNEGLDGFEERKLSDRGVDNQRDKNSIVTRHTITKNHHPTVKPTDLMRYLCRLVTPPNGVILDPFTGSGSTGKAAVLEGFSFIGVEQSEEYIKIAQARIESANK